MKITICETDKLNDIEIIIKCKKYDENVKEIVSGLKTQSPVFIGQRDKKIYNIVCDDIFYFETIENKIFIYCENQVYQIDSKLYEAEQSLAHKWFLRISKSILLNTKKLESVKALLNGRYEAHLINKESLIITRHYVPALKEHFGL